MMMASGRSLNLSGFRREILKGSVPNLKDKTLIYTSYKTQHFVSLQTPKDERKSKPQTQNSCFKSHHLFHLPLRLRHKDVGSYPIWFPAPRPFSLHIGSCSDKTSGQETSSDGCSLESSAENEVALVFRCFRVYKDGRIELLKPDDSKIPPSDDPTTGVRLKDVIISLDPPISARLYLPKLEPPYQKSKFPLLFYVHGGGFCMRSAFSHRYHSFCCGVAAEANCIVVSIEYGLFPARPLPACYEDSWAGLQWMASHVHGNGSEPWLNDHADFSKVIIAGNSAGGNIWHTLAARLGSEGLSGEVKVDGMILVHPFFGGVDKDDMWLYMFPGNNGGSEDPRLKPSMEDLARLGCKRVLIFVGEEDFLKPAGSNYFDKLKESGWKGSVELVEQQKVDHSFHLKDPNCSQAVGLKEKFVHFLKHD